MRLEAHLNTGVLAMLLQNLEQGQPSNTRSLLLKHVYVELCDLCFDLSRLLSNRDSLSFLASREAHNEEL